MFRLTLDGKSQYEVAKYFNKKGYATGMTYYKTGRIYREKMVIHSGIKQLFLKCLLIERILGLWCKV